MIAVYVEKSPGISIRYKLYDDRLSIIRRQDFGRSINIEFELTELKEKPATIWMRDINVGPMIILGSAVLLTLLFYLGFLYNWESHNFILGLSGIGFAISTMYFIRKKTKYSAFLDKYSNIVFEIGKRGKQRNKHCHFVEKLSEQIRTSKCCFGDQH